MQVPTKAVTVIMQICFNNNITNAHPPGFGHACMHLLNGIRRGRKKSTARVECVHSLRGLRFQLSLPNPAWA